MGKIAFEWEDLKKGKRRKRGAARIGVLVGKFW